MTRRSSLASPASPIASSTLSSAAPIAFVTYEGLPELNADDRRAAVALEDLGLRTDAVRWDDPRVDWLGYGAVVLRSTWDYHRRIAEFHAWIDRMEAIGAHLWNPPRVLRWNTDKRYLARVAHPSLAPPPTAILERGSLVNLPALLEARGWSEAVVKPAISADGFSTERASREGAASDQAVLDAMLCRGDVIVQRLVPEIRTNGEISMMFFSGVFSHAVSKRPQAGEFRVQERLGGKIARTDPPSALVEHAHALLDVHAQRYLYARVDVVATAERFVLMEVELVEPSLYLAHHPPSARAFALAIQRIA
jgi:glutathione synthase/RimK-type ligase-like ATP-grasp enzyme